MNLTYIGFCRIQVKRNPQKPTFIVFSLSRKMLY